MSSSPVKFQLHEAVRHATLKGRTRFSSPTADTRVRPPRVATHIHRRLFGEDWRHIRTDTVCKSMQAEDIVVLWAHFKDPGTIREDNLDRRHLNFNYAAYQALGTLCIHHTSQTNPPCPVND